MSRLVHVWLVTTAPPLYQYAYPALKTPSVLVAISWRDVAITQSLACTVPTQITASVMLATTVKMAAVLYALLGTTVKVCWKQTWNMLVLYTHTLIRVLLTYMHVCVMQVSHGCKLIHIHVSFVHWVIIAPLKSPQCKYQLFRVFRTDTLRHRVPACYSTVNVLPDISRITRNMHWIRHLSKHVCSVGLELTLNICGML
jgi:hypothetical protein